MPRFDDDNQPPYLPLRQGSAPAAATRAEDSHVATLDLPKEVTTAEAAKILGCDRKQIIKFIQHGLLAVRNKTGPWSTRPQFAVELQSLLNLRCSYRTQGREQTPATSRPQRRVLRRHGKRTGYISLD
jgi:hypothetical protein